MDRLDNGNNTASKPIEEITTEIEEKKEEPKVDEPAPVKNR